MSLLEVICYFAKRSLLLHNIINDSSLLED